MKDTQVLSKETTKQIWEEVRWQIWDEMRWHINLGKYRTKPTLESDSPRDKELTMHLDGAIKDLIRSKKKDDKDE